MKTLLTILLFGMAFLNPAMALETNHVFRVGVMISGDSSEELGSYIKRQLRSLGDVAVTDEAYQMRLNVVVTTLKKRQTDETAYAVGCAFTTGGKNQQAIFMAQEVITEISLQKIAESIVTDFDTKILEDKRKVFDKSVSSILQTNAMR
jgi:hypothetical protein